MDETQLDEGRKIEVTDRRQKEAGTKTEGRWEEDSRMKEGK
jgi:hypothetical protein